MGFTGLLQDGKGKKYRNQSKKNNYYQSRTPTKLSFQAWQPSNLSTNGLLEEAI